jgi:glycosyltransferase involved in cell wall biosynthesis
MTTLRVVLEPLVTNAGEPLGRYTTELTRALVDAAPWNCDVTGIVSAVADEEYHQIASAVPGIANLEKAYLASRELSVAWQLGIVSSAGAGLIHSPSLLAPLRRHDRADGTQITVTLHDLYAWSSPDSLTPAVALWQKSMLKRARKHADAIIVPSHALAQHLAEVADFGDRIRVIPGAGRTWLELPADAEARARALQLPDDFILAEGTFDEREGIGALIEGVTRSSAIDLPLLVFAPAGAAEAAAETHYTRPTDGSVRILDDLDDADRAVVLSRASVFVFPSLDEGFGAPILDALRFGVPVVHSDAPALIELVQEAGVRVSRDDAAGYPERLAGAVQALLEDTDLARRLAIVGADRVKAFSWRDAAERVWQLHADL